MTPTIAGALYALTTTQTTAQLAYQATIDGTSDLPGSGKLVQLCGDLANLGSGITQVRLQLFKDAAREQPLTEELALPINVSPTDATKGGINGSIEFWYSGAVYASCRTDAGTAGLTLCVWALS